MTTWLRRHASLAALVAVPLIGAAALVVTQDAAPLSFQNASSDDDVDGDISGPCDEAEHAGDPRCDGIVNGAAPTEPPPPVSEEDGSEHRQLDAAGAGAVTYAVDGGTLLLIDVTPAPGWVVEVEQSQGQELDLDLRSGSQRVQVDIEIDDGVPRERVRVRDDSSGPGGGDDGSRTEDDHDRSGPGAGGGDDDSHDDIRDDSSGPGHGGDDSLDDDLDDDHDDGSGPGGGDDSSDDD